MQAIRRLLQEHSNPVEQYVQSAHRTVHRQLLREDVSHIQNAAGISIDRSTNCVRGVKLLGWRSRNSNRQYVPEGVNPALYRNASVNINHPTEEEKKLPRPFVSRFGWIGDDTQGEEGPVKKEDGVYGTLYYNPRHPLVEAFLWWVQNKPDKVGLSHVAFGDVWEGASGELVENLDEVRSVDIVTDSATTNGMFEGFPGDRPGKKALVEAFEWWVQNKPDKLPRGVSKRTLTEAAETCWECGGSGVGPDGRECPECLGGHARSHLWKEPKEDARRSEQSNHPVPPPKPASTVSYKVKPHPTEAAGSPKKPLSPLRMEGEGELSFSSKPNKHGLHTAKSGEHLYGIRPSGKSHSLFYAGPEARGEPNATHLGKHSSFEDAVAAAKQHHLENVGREPGPAPNLPYGYDEGCAAGKPMKEGEKVLQEPMTKKGEKIERNMEKEYGKKKGEEVFYASANKGTIKGVHEGTKKVKEGNAMIGLKDDKGKVTGTSQGTGHNPESGGGPNKVPPPILEADDDEDLETPPGEADMAPGGDDSIDGDPDGGEPGYGAGDGGATPGETGAPMPDASDQVAGNDGALDLSEEMLSAITKVVTSTLSNQDKRKRVGMILKGMLHDMQEGLIPKDIKGAKTMLQEGLLVSPTAVQMVLRKLDAYETRDEMVERTKKAIELCEGMGLPESYRSDYFIGELARTKSEKRQRAMIDDRKVTFARAHMKPRSALGDDLLLEGSINKTKPAPKTEEEKVKAQEEAYSEFEQEALGLKS